MRFANPYGRGYASQVKTFVQMFLGLLTVVVAFLYPPIIGVLPAQFALVFLGGLVMGNSLGGFGMRCGNCRGFVLPGSRYCGKCGQELY